MLLSYDFMNIALIIFFSVCIDIFFGWPKVVINSIGHPIIWVGKLINFFDLLLNKDSFKPFFRYFFGILTLLTTTILCVFLAISIVKYTNHYKYNFLFLIVLIWPFIAINSMYSHIKDIIDDLEKGNIKAARFSTSKIVSRDTESLSEKELIRASLESLSENTSDGIIAPIFWALLFGLPGIVAYKVVNTLDSMIGYKNYKYNYFGWASAKLDDLINYFPARITSILFLIFSKNVLSNFKNLLIDAPKHKSPNAGWPEAAFAYTINVRLSGPRMYDGLTYNEKWVNEYGLEPKLIHLKQSLILFKKVIILLLLLLLTIHLIIEFTL